MQVLRVVSWSVHSSLLRKERGAAHAKMTLATTNPSIAPRRFSSTSPPTRRRNLLLSLAHTLSLLTSSLPGLYASLVLHHVTHGHLARRTGRRHQQRWLSIEAPTASTRSYTPRTYTRIEIGSLVGRCTSVGYWL